MHKLMSFTDDGEKEEIKDPYISSIENLLKDQSKDQSTQRLPNWKKFPPSSMKRIHKRRHTTKSDSRKFRLFCSKITPCVFYTIEELVKQYNLIFTDNPITRIGFGRLSDVREKFTKHRKVINGEKITLYVKNT